MKDYKNADTLYEMYHEKKMSQPEIAEYFECDTTTISYWMDKYDIETDDRQYKRAHEASRKNKANYMSNDMGYYYWQDGNEYVSVHRLLAIAVYGIDAVKGNHIHHKNKIPWDNRPDNIEPMDVREHHQHHAEERGWDVNR